MVPSEGLVLTTTPGPSGPLSGRAGPLTGVRVIDFSRVLSGPHCGRSLSDLGADVIKVEPPAGDLTRFSYPRRNSLAFYFVQQNAGKRNVSLDLARPEAVDLLLRLVATSDVVLENFRPGVMARLGLGYDAVAALNPRVVYGSITGYGQSGPWSDRRAYAAVIHAEMGMTHRSIEHHRGVDGDAAGPPLNDAFSHADTYAGLECLAGILAALYQRERTGRGQHVDVAMASVLLNVNEHVQNELSDIEEGVEPASLSPGGAPIFPTVDGGLVTTLADPLSKGGFLAYCAAMARPDLVEDVRFAETEDRRANVGDFMAVVAEWVLGFDDVVALEGELSKGRLALGVVRSVAEAAASDWARERGAIVEVSDRGGGTIRIPEAPWRFSDASAGVAGDPAYRGEHNRQVFAELGLDDAELDRLEADGVLSSRVPAAAT